MILVEGDRLKEVQDVKISNRSQLTYILYQNRDNKEEVRQLIKSIPNTLAKIQMVYNSYELMFSTYGIDLLDDLPHIELLYIVQFLPLDDKTWDLMF